MILTDLLSVLAASSAYTNTVRVRSRRGKHVALVAVILALLAACVTSPLGRTQLRLFSNAEMQAMGIAAFSEMRKESPASRSVPVTDYVECVANSITGILGNSNVDWEVVVFENPQVNAFALPGGKIGVYTGLLGVAESQNQLAAVIGHEIAHVQAGHTNERLSTNTLTQVGMQVVASISGPPSTQRDRALAALGLGVQVGVLLPFSRTQEQEADIIGLDLMARAGFDPRESIALWQNMARQDKAAPPEFLSTHPSSASRIQALQGHMPLAISLYRSAVSGGRRPDCSSADITGALLERGVISVVWKNNHFRLCRNAAFLNVGAKPRQISMLGTWDLRS